MKETVEPMSEVKKKAKSGCQKGKEKKLAELHESASKSRSVKSYSAKIPAAIHSTTASVATQLETDERFEGEFSLITAPLHHLLSLIMLYLLKPKEMKVATPVYKTILSPQGHNNLEGYYNLRFRALSLSAIEWKLGAVISLEFT